MHVQLRGCDIAWHKRDLLIVLAIGDSHIDLEGLEMIMYEEVYGT